MRRKFTIIPMLCIWAMFTGIATAQNNEPTIDQLNVKILHLQQQIMEMQKKHDAEINALKQQVDALSSQAAKQHPKDELTSLRELAQAEAVRENPLKKKRKI